MMETPLWDCSTREGKMLYLAINLLIHGETGLKGVDVKRIVDGFDKTLASMEES